MATDFTIQEFLEWARLKPADEGYGYCSNDNCALAQFLKATGRSSNPNVGGGPLCEWDDNDRKVHTFDEAVDLALEARPNNFGALAERLEAIVQETPAKPSPWLNPAAYSDVDVGEIA